MKQTLLLAGLFTVLAAQADTVSWNLDNNSTVGGDGAGSLPLSPPEAGAILADNWSNSWPDNPTVDLRNSDGNPTTIDIAYSPGGSWAIDFAHPGQDADGSWNKELLNGYLNAGGGGTSTVTLSQIPYTTYDLYVYFSADVADREGSVTDGTTTYYFRTIGQPTTDGVNAILTQTTDTVDDAQDDAANYAVFTGLSGGTKTLTVAIPGFGGIAGFQINGQLPSSITINTPPTDQSAAVDSNVTFSAAAAGADPILYQWEYSANGTSGWSEIPGAELDTFTLAFVQPSDEGYYRVVARDETGTQTATSDAAFLDVFYANPEILTQPQPAYVEYGSTVALSVEAFGYGTLTYQWFKNGLAIPDETSETLVLAGVSPADDGNSYYVVITDDTEPGLETTSNTVGLFTFPAWSSLVSYEPFDLLSGYSVGLLPLQNPAIAGYSGEWSRVDFGDAGPAIAETTLSFAKGAALETSGDKASVATSIDPVDIDASNSGRTSRQLAPQLVVTNATTGTRYMSFLFQSGQETGATVYQTLALNNGDGDGNRNFDAGLTNNGGQSGSEYDFGVDGIYTSSGVAADTGVHLFVVKFELSDIDFNDNVTVWVDPVLGGGEPAGGVTFSGADLTWDRIRLSDYDGNSASWDEIRWGSTFDSVTPSTELEGYAGWISQFDVNGMTAIDEDPDGDGLDNGVENFLGTDPSVSNSGLVIVNGPALTFTHPVNAAPAGDITASYKWSTNLQDWYASGASNGSSTVTFAPSVAGGVATVTTTKSGSALPKLFVRIEATRL